ncbi:hypothetical protein VP01_2662g1 [Puccinia sorghi]|uniref:Uncharacterized protein n=1 Tax=Puccinia sorghi TaxID=27349 RepID=A0A0L6V4P8_9BASI|nr:hypothetical protein VP01_2662g1 [Puccinia sorghi]
MGTEDLKPNCLLLKIDVGLFLFTSFNLIGWLLLCSLVFLSLKLGTYLTCPKSWLLLCSLVFLSLKLGTYLTCPKCFLTFEVSDLSQIFFHWIMYVAHLSHESPGTQKKSSNITQAFSTWRLGKGERDDGQIRDRGAKPERRWRWYQRRIQWGLWFQRPRPRRVGRQQRPICWRLSLATRACLQRADRVLRPARLFVARHISQQTAASHGPYRLDLHISVKEKEVIKLCWGEPRAGGCATWRSGSNGREYMLTGFRTVHVSRGPGGDLFCITALLHRHALLVKDGKYKFIYSQLLRERGCALLGGKVGLRGVCLNSLRCLPGPSRDSPHKLEASMGESDDKKHIATISSARSPTRLRKETSTRAELDRPRKTTYTLAQKITFEMITKLLWVVEDECCYIYIYIYIYFVYHPLHTINEPGSQAKDQWEALRCSEELNQGFSHLGGA